MTNHVLKTWPEYFDAIEDGTKTFDVRVNDRNFQVGDTVTLRRTQREPGRGPSLVGYQRRDLETTRKVSYVLSGGQFGVEPGFVVLGLKEMWWTAG